MNIIKRIIEKIRKPETEVFTLSYDDIMEHILNKAYEDGSCFIQLDENGKMIEKQE